MIRSIAEAILLHAEKNSEKTAIIFEHEEYSYRELAESAKKVAMWLKSVGIAPGDRVIVEASPTFRYVAFCYGVHLSRGVFVPLENGTPTERMKEVTGSISASAIVTINARVDLPGSFVMEKIWQDICAISADGFVYDVPQDDDLV